MRFLDVGRVREPKDILLAAGPRVLRVRHMQVQRQRPSQDEGDGNCLDLGRCRGRNVAKLRPRASAEASERDVTLAEQYFRMRRASIEGAHALGFSKPLARLARHEFAASQDY